MRLLKIAASVLVLLLASTTQLLAQGSSTGTILGRVSDASGASLPGANVIIMNTATGTAHSVKSNGSGDYTVPELQPGPYKVTVEAPGFGSQVSSLTVVVAQEARVDAQLKLGGAVETIEVNTSGAQLDTDTASCRSSSVRSKWSSYPSMAATSSISCLSVRVPCKP